MDRRPDLPLHIHVGFQRPNDEFLRGISRVDVFRPDRLNVHKIGIAKKLRHDPGFDVVDHNRVNHQRAV